MIGAKLLSVQIGNVQDFEFVQIAWDAGHSDGLLLQYHAAAVDKVQRCDDGKHQHKQQRINKAAGNIFLFFIQKKVTFFSHKL